MRIPSCAIVVVMLSAVLVLGCGGDEENKPVDLKGTADTSNLKGMLGKQTKDLKVESKISKAEKTSTPKE